MNRYEFNTSPLIDSNLKHRPRKRFGQHFLQDYGVIADIVSAIDPKPQHHMVEIGPGQGVLTDELIQYCQRLDIIELDRDLAKSLSRKYQGNDRVTLHVADALSFDFANLYQEETNLRIVGNLPYNISTPLLFHLLEFTGIVKNMHFMLQKEVADRLCAQPGSKAYGKLSVMLQYIYLVEKLFDVNPESFKPAPKVISALVRLTPRPTPPVTISEPAIFKKVVTQAFSQRRKTLKNNLKLVLSADQIRALGIDPTSRAETLDLKAFAKLSNQVFDNKQTT